MKKAIKKIKKYAEGGELETLDAENSIVTGDPVVPPKTPKGPVTEEQWNALKQKYTAGLPQVKPYGANEKGSALDKRMKWTTWANQKLPTSGTPAELSAKAAKQAGIDPGMLLASSLEEGVGLRFMGQGSDYSNAYIEANKKGELKDYPVDAFRNYGLDQIGGRVDEFIKKGYLPADIKNKMKVFNASNELDEKEYYQKAYNAIKGYEGLGGFKYSSDRATYDKIDKILNEYEIEGVPEMKASAKTAAFKDDESAYMAKAAFLRSEQENVGGYAKQKGYKLTPEEQKFFTMASYNGGIGNAQQMLDYYGNKKELGNNAFLKDRGNKGQIYDNILPRYAGANLFTGEGYFEYGGVMPKKPKYNDGGLIIDPDKPIKGKPKPKIDEGFPMPTVDGNGIILPNGETVINGKRIGMAPPLPPEIDEGFLMPGQTRFGGPVANIGDAPPMSPYIDEGFIMPITANTKLRGVRQYDKGGKVPKYQDGTEDPIKPFNVSNPGNVGINTFATPTTNIPINPNAPLNEQIFRVPQQDGTSVDQGNIIPLTQFANGNYVNNQGQTTPDASTASKASAESFSNTLEDAEKIGSLGITAINAYFNKQNTARTQRTDRRQAIMQQQFSPTVNPYLEGTGSQAIMKYGGGLSRGDDYGSKSKPYPSVSSSDFAGGGRSYPIPTKADAEDALRLAHLHGRSDVIAKIHSKYPDLKYGGAIMNMPEYSSGGTIHIKPENRGKFNATKKRTGKSTEELTHSSNPVTKKRAIFAQNAAKWHHGEDGLNLPAEEMTNDMQILDGGNAKVISTSDHSNSMFEFSGKDHKDGGIGIQYGRNMAEVEHEEVGWIDQEGGLNIFGKLKLPGTSQTFRKTAKDIADQEAKVDGEKSKYLNILTNGSTTDPYQESAQSTAKVMFKSLDKQSKQIAEKKEALASYQNLILAMANEGESKMKYGGKLPRKPYATGGEVQEDEFDFTGDPTPENIKKIAQAIGQFESSAKYDAIGVPVTKGQYKGQRALGKYQIMEDNMRSWGKAATGRDITVAEFIKDPKLQDQVAEYQMSQIAKSNPNPADIASVWFTGRPTSNKSAGSAKDDLGTSGNQYVDAVMKIYGGIDNSNDPGEGNRARNQQEFDLLRSKWESVANNPGSSYSDKRYAETILKTSFKDFATYVDTFGTPPPKANNSNNNENALNYTPNYTPIAGGNVNSSIETPYGKARKEPTPFSDKANIGVGSRERGFISPLAIEQIAPELLTVATNRRDPVNQLTYQPDLKQTFDISYQLGRNENQSTFNAAAKIAESTGNIDALSELAAQKYKADQQYNMQEVQGNAQQKLQTYSQNIDVLNDAKVKNLALIADQQVKQAQSKFNTRQEDLAAFKSISGKSLQNQLENKTYNAYANLFKHYGFDRKGNVTFEADKIAQRFTAGEAQQFGMMAAQQGANAIMNGDFSRKFTKVKNQDGSQTTTETLGTNKRIQEEYKTLKNQGFDDGIIGNMLRAKYPETISQD